MTPEHPENAGTPGQSFADVISTIQLQSDVDQQVVRAELTRILGRHDLLAQESMALLADTTIAPIDATAMVLIAEADARDAQIEELTQATLDRRGEDATRETAALDRALGVRTRLIEDLRADFAEFNGTANAVNQSFSAAPASSPITPEPASTGGPGTGLLVGLGIAAAAAVVVGAFVVLGGGDGTEVGGANAGPTSAAAQPTAGTEATAAVAGGEGNTPSTEDVSAAVFPVPALAADLFGAVDIEASVRVRVGDSDGVMFLVDRAQIPEPPAAGETRVFAVADTDGAFIESALRSGIAFAPKIRVFDRRTIEELVSSALSPDQAIVADGQFELFFPLILIGGTPHARVDGVDYPLSGMRFDVATRDADNNNLFSGAVVVDVPALAQLQDEHMTISAIPTSDLEDRPRRVAGSKR